MRLVPAHGIDFPSEPSVGYFVPLVRFALPVGSCSPPGLMGVSADHQEICQPLSLSILDQAPLWLVGYLR